jgi:hypothetical protein
MKDLSGAISLAILFFFLTILLFGRAFLDAYNTQQDRQMFLKTYEVVMECRKSYTVSESAKKICGELPSFTDEVG